MQLSWQNLEALEMTAFRVCLCTPREHNWENTAVAGTEEMKHRKAFGAAESGDHKNLGLILTFLRVYGSQ